MINFPYRWSRRPLENLRWIFLRTINFFERGYRGYGRADTWDLFFYLSEICIGALNQLRNEGVEHPVRSSQNEWDDLLLSMIEGFEAAKRLADGDWVGEEHYKILEIKYSVGMKAFCEHFMDLWDARIS